MDMTVGELRRMIEPLADEAQVLLPTMHPSIPFMKVKRCNIEMVRITKRDGHDGSIFSARYSPEELGHAQAALVIR
jgi:hypothetical protein